MKVYGAGLLSSAAELQYVMNGVEVSESSLSLVLILKHLVRTSSTFGVEVR
jgi:phenylalanine-4-hydroxylase